MMAFSAVYRAFHMISAMPAGDKRGVLPEGPDKAPRGPAHGTPRVGTGLPEGRASRPPRAVPLQDAARAPLQLPAPPSVACPISSPAPTEPQPLSGPPFAGVHGVSPQGFRACTALPTLPAARLNPR